jgi:hypothetical protein
MKKLTIISLAVGVALTLACAMPRSTPPANAPATIAIVVDAYDKNGVEVNNILIAVVATGLRKDGSLGEWSSAAPDGSTTMVPYPMRIAVNPPFSHSLTVLPGESTVMEFSATMIAKVGWKLECSVYINGVFQFGDDETITPIANVDVQVWNGSAVVRCDVSYTNAV